MTDEELREKLLQIETKCVRLENILLKLIDHHREDIDKWDEAEKYLEEILK